MAMMSNQPVQFQTSGLTVVPKLNAYLQRADKAGSMKDSTASQSGTITTPSTEDMETLAKSPTPSNSPDPSFNNPISPSKATEFFLVTPAEIRNHIYSYLMPDVANIKDAIALMSTCKRINRELQTMLVAETDRIMEQTHLRSVATRKAACTCCPAAPFFATPVVRMHIQLRNINIAFSMGYNTTSQRNHSKEHPQRRRIDFCEAFADLKQVLDLHVPYVTITLYTRLDGNANLWHPDIRYFLLKTGYNAFNDLQRRSKASFNARYIIFELKPMTDDWIGPMPEDPIPEPVIVFEKQLTKKKNVRYTFHGHDPTFELRKDVDLWGNPVCTDQKMLEKLKAIVERSRVKYHGS
jgi:hypothetical protein